MSTRKIKPRTPPPIPDRVEFETFRDHRGSYYVGGMTQAAPSCFNGCVQVRKFKVTIELVDEPVEVVGARIQALWDASDNYHHHEPLKRAAEAIGYTPQGPFGSKRPRP